MANSRKRISELPPLNVASLDTTFVLGISGSTTYKISINNLTSSLDTTFASDLVTTALSSSLDGKVSTSSFNQYIASALNGTISGSSQLTSSYDQRYVVSGSITQTTWDNIANKPAGIVSQSTDLSSLNTFTQSIDNRVDSLESWSSSLTDTFATDLEVSIVSSSVAATIGIVSQATGLVNTSSFNEYTASQSTSSLVDRLGQLEFSASRATSSITELYDNAFIWTQKFDLIDSISGSWITESETGSFLTSLSGAISSSSQLTSSFDTRYVASGSISAVPAGTISGSSQLTSSYDSRYSLSGSVLTSFSSSVDTRLDTLEVSIITGSVNYVQKLGSRVTGVTSTGVTIISEAITTTGNPIQIMVTGDANPVNVTSWTRLQIYRNETAIGNIVQVENSSNLNVPYCLNVIDTPSAGTYTYSMRTVSGISGLFDFGESTGPTLTAVELRTNTNLPSTNNSFTGTNTFNNTTTFASAGGDEGGEIQFGVPVTNTTLQNRVTVDVWQNRLRFFEGSANANGVYIDLSKPTTGNNNEITYKASGIVNAGTFVTLDNIKATVTTSGQRGLSLATVSGTFACNIGGNFAGAVVGASGYGGTATITTTPSTSIFGWGFTAIGDMANYIITDTTNSRAYRIIIQIGNAFNNNLVSIERLH
jgi:hypothetical protein